MNYQEMMQTHLPPEGKQGVWEISKFTVPPRTKDYGYLAALFSGEAVHAQRWPAPGDYLRLTNPSGVVMSNTPAEIHDHFPLWEAADAVGSKTALVNGLGLGMATNLLLEMGFEVTTIEISQDVISLTAPTLQKAWGNRLKVIHADALKWRPEKGVRFGVVWNDIWQSICTDDCEERAKLNRSYAQRSAWTGAWATDLLRHQKRREASFRW